MGYSNRLIKIKIVKANEAWIELDKLVIKAKLQESVQKSVDLTDIDKLWIKQRDKTTVMHPEVEAYDLLGKMVLTS
jgi:hypothetical protein